MSFSNVLLKQPNKIKEYYTSSLSKCTTPKITEYSYKLDGPPIPLRRPKLTTFPVPHAYDSQKQVKAESQLELRFQHGYCKLIEGPISLEITFFMKIPASYSKKKKDALIDQPHIKKPDLSNLIKYLEDVAQGIIFRDDAIIDKITAKKQYSDNPRTEFIIRTERDNEEAKKQK